MRTTGLALKIDTIIQIPNASKPWKDNPIGISAVLIAPPIVSDDGNDPH